MMSEREQMKKVIEDAFMEDYDLGCDPCAETVAKHLCNAGWRKQEWISVEDRLPEAEKEVLAKMIYNAGWRKQKEGEWISLEPEIGLFACSLCDHRILRAKCNYCPNCGAKMKGGE